MKRLSDNFRTRKIEHSILLMLFLFFLIAAFNVDSQKRGNKIHSTKNIDITVKDKDGYNHFPVFTKIMTPNKSYIAYTVE